MRDSSPQLHYITPQEQQRVSLTESRMADVHDTPDNMPPNIDPVVISWADMAKRTPFSESTFKQKFAPYLRENHYVIRDQLGKRVVYWTWESMLKAGIIRCARERQLLKAARKAERLASEQEPVIIGNTCKGIDE